MYPFRSVMSLSMLCLIVILPSCTRDESQLLPRSHRESPVFFEMFADHYSDSVNLELLPKGKVRLESFPVTHMAGPDWALSDGDDPTWWPVMERLLCLLPAIDSPEESHQALARRWFDSWYATHAGYQSPNPGAWDAMGAGFRVVVLVRYLKRVEEENGDNELASQLRKSIAEHQRFLADPKNFEDNNNHGMWQAMGLFESTRVVADAAVVELALDRLLRLCEISVSTQGIHKEHSPGYHFFFYEWLSDFVAYFESLDRWRWLGLATLRDIEARMSEASYFLYDHAGKVPQIGDTDARTLENRHDAGRAQVCFDGEAGYAVYKDAPSSSEQRYVVFNIQNRSQPPELPFHYHSDALSVYCSWRGEIILGDQGRYEYSHTRIRQYFISPAAHNCISDRFEFNMNVVSSRPTVADSVWRGDSSNETVFCGTQLGGRLRRCIRVLAGNRSIEVLDEITAAGDYVMTWNIGSDVLAVTPRATVDDGDSTVYGWELRTAGAQRFLMEITVTGTTSTASGIEVLAGRERPMLGWYSPAYRTMLPSSVIKVALATREHARVITTVQRLQ